MTTAGKKRELVQQVLQSQWQKIGVKVSINNQPARVYFGETLNQRKHKGLAMFAWYSSPESPHVRPCSQLIFLTLIMAGLDKIILVIKSQNGSAARSS